jgi:hypothetical protein
LSFEKQDDKRTTNKMHKNTFENFILN